MGHDDSDATLLKKSGQAPRKVREVERYVLIDESERDQGTRGNAGQCHGGLELAPALSRVSLVPGMRSRRAIGHVNHGDTTKAMQLATHSDRLVVGMSDDDGNLVGAQVRRPNCAELL